MVLRIASDRDEDGALLGPFSVDPESSLKLQRHSLLLSDRLPLWLSSDPTLRLNFCLLYSSPGQRPRTCIRRFSGEEVRDLKESGVDCGSVYPVRGRDATLPCSETLGHSGCRLTPSYISTSAVRLGSALSAWVVTQPAPIEARKERKNESDDCAPLITYLCAS